MVEISASMVKDLREKTGAGMMDCKKALTETNGEFEKAVEWLRKKGIASAAKKVGRATNQGLVSAYIDGEGKAGVLVEINCETDFVARTEQFKDFVKTIGTHIAQAKPKDMTELMNQSVAAADGKTVQVYLQQMIGSLGENMGIGRFALLETAADGKGAVSSYIHGEGKVGVLVDIGVANAAAVHGDAFKTFARDLAMHIAAAAPRYVTSNEVPAEIIAKEKEIATAQIQNSGKPMKPEFMGKAVDGRVRKLLEEICLMTQPFVKDPNKTIEQLRKEMSATLGGEVTIRRFARFVLGQGLE